MSEDPYKIDFAALRTLRAVRDEQSFSRAAERMGVSQSVVSYTIDKLRGVLGDPLFLRQGGGIVATDRCATIVASAERILDSFEALILPRAVAPAEIRHRFTLSCNYYERRRILPLVARQLRRCAPKAELVVIPSGTEGPKQLESGEADVLIGPMRPDAEGFYRRNLIAEHYVCIMDGGNPLVSDELTLESYAAARHIGIDYGRGWVSGYVNAIRAAGGALTPVITVPSPAGIEDLIHGTDLLATVPAGFARTLDPRLHVAPCPVEAPFEVDLVWTLRTHTSPLHQWFRRLIADTVKADVSPVD